MTTLLLALLAALAVGLVAWRLVVARRAPTPPATDKPVAAPPAVATAPAPTDAEAQAARASARAKAERVIAAEQARRKAAIQKAQNAARVEAERRAADAAKAAAALASTLPANQLPPVALKAPVAAPTPVVEKTTPIARPAPVAARAPAVPSVLKSVEQTLVMLVDDSKMVRVKSSRLLASHGFQVVTAVDGIDALKQLENCCPDIVITDVDMPEMDGFGLVAALRGNPRTQAIPLVMITSAEDRHREEATRVGVGLVMGKPYDEVALIAHIRSFKFFAKAEEAESLACA